MSPRGLWGAGKGSSHRTVTVISNSSTASQAGPGFGPLHGASCAVTRVCPVDAAVKKAAGTIDENQRKQAYLDTQRLIISKDPAFWNFFGVRSKRGFFSVAGFEPAPHIFQSHSISRPRGGFLIPVIFNDDSQSAILHPGFEPDQSPVRHGRNAVAHRVLQQRLQ